MLWGSYDSLSHQNCPADGTNLSFCQAGARTGCSHRRYNLLCVFCRISFNPGKCEFNISARLRFCFFDKRACFRAKVSIDVYKRQGRGKAKSYCILTTHNRNPETLQRLKALCKTTDGFKIAEEDLRLRGPGDFFGSRQSGLPAFRVADLGCDLAAMKDAQQASADWIDAYGASDTPEANALRERIGDLFARSEGTMN